MKLLKWRTTPGGYQAFEGKGAYVIQRRSYGKRFTFEAYHLGKRIGFSQSTLSSAKRDAQQHADGFRGNVASTDPDLKARSDWCHCEPERGER